MPVPELKDVRPPVELPANYFWLLVMIGILLLISGYFLIRWILKRFKKAKEVVVPVKMPWELAYEELAALERDNLPAKGDVKEYFFRLSMIVRHYLERRFDLSAPEMTTDEFLIHLKTTNVLTEKQKDSLREFLTASDMIKFAKYGASIEEMIKAFEVVKRLVEETKAT